MAKIYTVAELITKFRIRGGYESSGRMTDAKVIDFLECGLSELHDLLITKFGDDYFTTRVETAYTANDDTYDLPTNFLKLLRADRKDGTTWCRMRRVQLCDIGDGTTGTPTYYRIEGDSIMLDPPPSSSGTYRLIYIKCAPKLTTSGSPPAGSVNQVDGYNGWENLAILYALWEAKDSQGEPTDGIERRIARLLARVDWAADGRDASEPLRIQDLEDDVAYDEVLG